MSRLFYWSLTSALAGFLFGFDTIVISGAEQKFQQLWNLDDTIHGLAMSAALWGTVIGSLYGGWQTETFGRRKTLLSIGILYFVSAVGSGIAPDVYSFMLARFIGGLGVGVATVASPLYISEIAPPQRRGQLAGLFQFNIVFGILVAFLSNYAMGQLLDPEIAWRWMLGIEALPALLYSIMCFGLPESPRWLISHQNQTTQAEATIRLINPEFRNEQVQQLIEAIKASRAQATVSEPFFSQRLRIPLTLAFLIAFFNQLSGINAILYFAPRIFEWTGLGAQSALLQSVGIGVTNLIFTYIGLWLIDRLGRKTLLLIGSIGYIVSLGLCAIAFRIELYTIVPPCLFAFIAAHAIGQGAVIWVFLSEIFPNRFRASGQALGSFTHWFFAASLTLVFPTMASMLAPEVIFGFFCLMMVLQLIWVVTMVPETKNVSLEELEERLGTR